MIGIVACPLPRFAHAHFDQPTDRRKEQQFSLHKEFGMTTVDGWDQVVVLDVASTGTAAMAGVQVGDVIQSIGGVRISTSEELNEISQLLKEGDQVEIIIERLGKEDLLVLEFISQPEIQSTAREDAVEKPRLSVEMVEAIPIENLTDGKLHKLDQSSQGSTPERSDRSLTHEQMLSTIALQKAEIERLKQEIEHLRRRLNKSANSMRF